jgi:hypothetical protein
VDQVLLDGMLGPNWDWASGRAPESTNSPCGALGSATSVSAGLPFGAVQAGVLTLCSDDALASFDALVELEALAESVALAELDATVAIAVLPESQAVRSSSVRTASVSDRRWPASVSLVPGMPVPFQRGECCATR